MKRSAVTRTKKHHIITGNLYLYVWGLVRDYSPENESETRRLLEVLNRHSSNGIDKQGFIERLATFWDMKISFQLDEIWSKIRNRDLANAERKMFLHAVDGVKKLIHSAVAELRGFDCCYENAESFLSYRTHLLCLKTLQSFLEDPFGEGEARNVRDVLSDGVWDYEITKIGAEEQADPKTVIIKPLRELYEDDLSGHMLRSYGVVDSWPAGRIIVAGWNLPIIETEEGEFLIPIENMLVEFGGCPLGLVYNRKQWKNNEGYNAKEKSCEHCWKKDFCPGNDVLRAWTLGSLAKKLHFAWEHRADVIKVLPAFEQKLLAGKK